MTSSCGKSHKTTIYCLFTSIILAAVFIIGCEKKGNTVSNPQLQTPPQQISAVSGGLSPATNRQNAVKQLNDYFRNVFYPVNPEKISYLKRNNFVSWLRSSNISAAEQLYLGPLLASSTTEFLLIRNVVMVETGKSANVVLVAVPQPLTAQYTRLMVLVDPLSMPTDRRLCMWKRCDASQACPCTEFLGYSSAAECPQDRCTLQTECQGYNPADCDETTYTVLFDPFKDELRP